MKHLGAGPHGELEEVLENIWFVKGGLKMPFPLPMWITRGMTVIRDASDGSLTVVNSMRLSEEGHERLDALGKVARVIRLGGFHGRDDGYYRERYGAKIFAVKGMTYHRGMKPDEGEDYLKPDVELDEHTALPLPNARLKVFTSSNPPEAILLLERDGGILISGDALQNTPAPDRYFNWLAKTFMKRMGFFKACNVGPGWLRFAKPHADDVRSVLDLDFEHVFPTHGDPVIGGAKAKFAEQIMGTG
jgi:hypothetical protein